MTIPNSPKKSKISDRAAALYIRYGTDTQLQQSQAWQEHACQDYRARVLPDLRADLFVDRFRGAARLDNRESLLSLLERVRAGAISDVVVVDVERLSRSIMDMVKIVELFERHGVKLHTVYNGIIERPRDALVLGLCAAATERERFRMRSALSRKWRRAKAAMDGGAR